MINSEDTTQLISLSRDCEVISVPYGEKEILKEGTEVQIMQALGGSYTVYTCLLYTSPSPRDRTRSRMPSSA